MPLSKLFHKKGSQKKKKKSDDSKDDSGTESDTIPTPRIEVLDENAVLETLVAQKVYLKMDTPPTPRNSTCEELLKPSVPPKTIPEGNVDKLDKAPSLESHSCENDGQSSKQITDRPLPKKKRSNSESNFEIEPEMMPSGRRKFGSEGQILPNSSVPISLEDRKQIDEVIGQYIDNLIKDSIVKAVKNVDVSSLRKEIVRDFSSRSNSESAESVEHCIIEQRVGSDSVSELIEFGDFNAIVSPENGATGNTAVELEDNIALGGYFADYEDIASAVDEDSSLCSVSDGLKQQSVIDSCKGIDKVVSLEIDGVSEMVKDHSDNSDIQLDVSRKREILASENQTGALEEHNRDYKKVTTEEEDSVLKELNTETQSPNKDEEQTCLRMTSLEDALELEPETGDCLTGHQSLSAFDGREETLTQDTNKSEKKFPSTESCDDLIAMSTECESLPEDYFNTAQNEVRPPDIDENLPQQCPAEEGRKVNWKAGYLHVKLPAKSRGKTHLKAWKKRCVAIQPDEFVNDPKNPSLVISVYGAESRKHKATFWQTVSSQKAVVYRSSSHTHRYAFTISEDSKTIIHLSADSESATQEWMSAIRSVLWPPSPFMQLEKMLSGREFEISLIDNEFSYHAGLLGMYGYLTITPRKLILLHPQEGFVIQEWYLNTVDKFQLVTQPKPEDSHKVLAMTTCSESSTGKGEILLFCNDAVTFLQSLASTIHGVLSHHSKQDGGKYRKELEEVAEWLVAPPQDSLSEDVMSEDHYKVPPRQVKSLLDIPNFIFNKSLSPVSSAIYPSPPSSEILEPLPTKSKQTTTSHDSGISTCHSGDDFLNCSVTSFVVGGGPMTGKSSDSDMSDTYTPPRTPEMLKKVHQMGQEKDTLPVPPTS